LFAQELNIYHLCFCWWWEIWSNHVTN